MSSIRQPFKELGRFPTVDDLPATDISTEQPPKRRRSRRQRKKQRVVVESSSDEENHAEENDFLNQQRLHVKTPISKATKSTRQQRRSRRAAESSSPVKPPSPLSINVSVGVMSRLAVIKNDVQGLKDMLLEDSSLVDDCAEAGENGAPDAGWTMLHVASSVGNATCVEIIIQCSPDLNARTEGGSTALHFACQGGHSTCVELLVNAGAQYHLKDILDETPKDVAKGAAQADWAICVEIIEEAEVAFGVKIFKIGGGVVGAVALFTGLYFWLRPATSASK